MCRYNIINDTNCVLKGGVMKFHIEELMRELDDEVIEKDMKVIHQAFALFKGWPIWKLDVAFKTIKFMVLTKQEE